MQPSKVQGFRSSHLKAPLHRPCAHLSPTVHASPSLHEAPLASAVLAQAPVLESQLSAVQEFWSSQLLGVPRQAPPEQASRMVQRLPSVHVVPTGEGECTHPIAGEQSSMVQRLPSSQVIPAPTQLPAVHASPAVHRFASEQAVPLGSAKCEHVPSATLQASALQLLPSSQLTGTPEQTLLEQESPVVQAFPSEQAVPVGAGACVQPKPAEQPSVVHSFPSLQLT